MTERKVLIVRVKGGIYRDWETNGKKCMGVFTQNYLINQTSMKGDRKSTRLNSSHSGESRMPSSA